MSEYFAEIRWTRSAEEIYIDNKYSRGHTWKFDGGLNVNASSSPKIVPIPYSVEAYVDPEEAYIASISSCHMLFFLSLAAKQRYVVDEYYDNALGVMEKGENETYSITKVWLRPRVKFSGDNLPTRTQVEAMHHQSHEQCFIANSVRSEIQIDIEN